MDFELNEAQQLLQQTVRQFADAEVRPKAAELDKSERWPTEIVARMQELGLMGIAVPEEWGGSGMDHVSYVVAMEELSAACASCGVIMSVNNSLACEPLLRFGTDEQKRRWLVPMASGQKLGCFALSEPGTGSDAAAQKTLAVRDGDVYVVNGTKNFITCGPHADVTVLFAMTDRPKGHKGITAFIVDKGHKGFMVGRHEEKLGIHAAHSSQLVFEDCRIPAAQVLGGEGQGFKVAMTTLDEGRIGIAAQALGIGRAAYEAALRYSKERQAFGAPIANLQAIQFMLADMAVQLDAARLLTLHAAELSDRHERHTRESAMAKLYASEAANRVANKALQVHGGYGYMREYAAERHFRDARITEIYEGTSEIQRLVIAGALLKEGLPWT